MPQVNIFLTNATSNHVTKEDECRHWNLGLVNKIHRGLYLLVANIPREFSPVTIKQTNINLQKHKISEFLDLRAIKLSSNSTINYIITLNWELDVELM